MALVSRLYASDHNLPKGPMHLQIYSIIGVGGFVPHFYILRSGPTVLSYNIVRPDTLLVL